jgi:hypothetical protein
VTDPPKPESLTRQVLILLFCWLALSIGSCAGFLNLSGGSGVLAGILALGFAAGVCLIIATVIWAVVRAVSRD